MRTGRPSEAACGFGRHTSITDDHSHFRCAGAADMAGLQAERLCGREVTAVCGTLSRLNASRVAR
jgi:hypothetical protein